MAATEVAVRTTVPATMIRMPPETTDHAITTAVAATATHTPTQVQAAAHRAMYWCPEDAAPAVHLIHVREQAATVHVRRHRLYALRYIRAAAVQALAAIRIIPAPALALQATYWYPADAVRAVLLTHAQERAAIRPALLQRHIAV